MNKYKKVLILVVCIALLISAISCKSSGFFINEGNKVESDDLTDASLSSRFLDGIDNNIKDLSTRNNRRGFLIDFTIETNDSSPSNIPAQVAVLNKKLNEVKENILIDMAEKSVGVSLTVDLEKFADKYVLSGSKDKIIKNNTSALKSELDQIYDSIAYQIKAHDFILNFTYSKTFSGVKIVNSHMDYIFDFLKNKSLISEKRIGKNGIEEVRPSGKIFAIRLSFVDYFSSTIAETDKKAIARNQVLNMGNGLYLAVNDVNKKFLEPSLQLNYLCMDLGEIDSNNATFKNLYKNKEGKFYKELKDSINFATISLPEKSGKKEAINMFLGMHLRSLSFIRLTDETLKAIEQLKEIKLTYSEMKKAGLPVYAKWFYDDAGNEVEEKSSFLYLKDFIGYHLAIINVQIDKNPNSVNNDDYVRVRFDIVNFGSAKAFFAQNLIIARSVKNPSSIDSPQYTNINCNFDRLYTMQKEKIEVTLPKANTGEFFGDYEDISIGVITVNRTSIPKSIMLNNFYKRKILKLTGLSVDTLVIS